jgi:hypothetical protein
VLFDRWQRREKSLDEPTIEITWFSFTALDRPVPRPAYSDASRNVLLAKPSCDSS